LYINRYSRHDQLFIAITFLRFFPFSACLIRE
jgi:hypothetical protein